MDENPYKSPETSHRQPFHFTRGQIFLLAYLIVGMIFSGIPGPHHALIETTGPFVAATGITVGVGGLLFLAAVRRRSR